jgi:hypothetical protein
MLKVEYDELKKRAAELEEFADKLVADFPAENPFAPCGLPFVVEGTEAAWQVIDSDRNLLKEAGDNLRDLAESLINAAKAYEEADESAAEAIDGETEVPEVVPDQADKGSTTPTTDRAALTATHYAGQGDGEAEPLKSAYQIYYGGDGGTGYSVFADELSKKYAKWLNGEVLKVSRYETTGPFRGFSEWQGDSATKVEEQLEKQRVWLKSFVEHFLDLAEKLNQVVDAYKLVTFTSGSPKWEVSRGFTGFGDFANADLTVKELGQHHSTNMHPVPEVVSFYKFDPNWNAGDDAREIFWGGGNYADEYTDKGLAKIVKKLQELSTAAQTEFKAKANYDGFASIEETAAGGTGSGRAPKVTYTIDSPSDTELGAGTDTEVSDPLADAGLGDAGLPTMPSLPSDLPSDVPTDTSLPADGVVGGVGAGSSKLPAGGLGGMRAASVGGGGGAPSMPLQPPVAAEGAGSAAGRGGPNLGGAGALAGGAAMGGRGGMGMAPMAGQGGKGEDSKAKRAQQDEEALYAEDRPWTEAVIGNRRRKDGPDNKESK